MINHKHGEFRNCFTLLFYSLHNYSSVYGEFYCTAHYKQLFKGKGNHEGFRNKQQKDQLQQKNRGVDEVDVSGPKTTKSYLNVSDGPRESSVFAPKSLAREVGNSPTADGQGKLKRTWPPEKKNTGFEMVQRQTRTCESSAGNHQSNSTHNGEIKTRVQVLSSPFIREDQEGPKTAPSDLRAEKVPPKTAPNPRLSSKEDVVKSTIKTLQQRHENPKTGYSPAPSGPDTDPSGGRKSVRFAASRPAPQTEMSGGDKSEGQDADTEQTRKRSSEASDKGNADLALGKGQEGKKEEYLEIPQYQSQRKTDPNPKPESSQESNVGPETPEPDGTLKNKEVVNDHQQAEATQEMAGGSGSPAEPGNPEEHQRGEEAGVEKDDSTTEHSQKKTNAKTNSLKNAANQAEKTKGKLGAWPTGRSPLSKLFTSEKTNKTEPKEGKKAEVKAGLLGRLFQSSSEKAEDSPKSPGPSGKNDRRQNTDEGKEMRKKEMQGGGDECDLSTPEPKVEAEDPSQSAEAKTSENGKKESGDTSTKPPALIQESASGAKDEPAAEDQTNANEPNPEVNDGNAGPSQPPSQDPEEKLDPPKAEPGGVQTEIFKDGIVNAGLASADQLSPQVKTSESGSGPQLMDPPGVEGPDPFAGEPPDHGSQVSSDPFGPRSSEGTFGTTADDVFYDHVPVLDFSHTEPQSDTQAEQPAAHMDIFASNDILLFESPAADTSTNSSSVLLDNMFGDSMDVFASLPPNLGSENPVSDSLGAAASSTLLQTDLFSGDIFAPGGQTLQASQPGGHNPFMDNFFISDSTEPAAPSGLTGNSWMDDLLG